jgi:ectoine hydroxylase-related dioxygenase (phytanoyl-CoA dioxygenase family)
MVEPGPVDVNVGVNGAKLRRYEVVVRNLLQQKSDLLPPPCFYQIVPQQPPPPPAVSSTAELGVVGDAGDPGDDPKKKKMNNDVDRRRRRREDKATRKRQQVESMLACIDLFLPHDDDKDDAGNMTTRTTKVVVDFGGGSGHLSIPLALRRPHDVLVLCVDLKRKSLDLLHKTAAAAVPQIAATMEPWNDHNDPTFLSSPPPRPPATLPAGADPRIEATSIANLFTLHGSVQSLDDTCFRFDVAVALHLCGEATDVVLRQAARQKAAIIVCPCCVGKLSSTAHNPYVYQSTGQNVATIEYPQSTIFRRILKSGRGGSQSDGSKNDEHDDDDWNALAKAADYGDMDCIRTARNAVRRTAKALLEVDRQCYLREAYGYESLLTRMQPWECTVKNDIIIAWPPDRPPRRQQQPGWKVATLPVDQECAQDLWYTRRHLFDNDDGANAVVVPSRTTADEGDAHHPVPSSQPPSADAAAMVDWTKQEEEEVVDRLVAFFGHRDVRQPQGNSVTYDVDPYARELVFSHCRHRKLVHAVAERMELLHWTTPTKHVVVALPLVTRAIVEAYQRDGVVVLRQVMTTDQIAMLREGIDRNMAHPSERAITAMADGDPGLFFEDFCNWESIPQYRQVLLYSRLPRIAAKLMASKTVRLYHDHLLVKEAGPRQPTPWHQDQPYYNITGDQNVTFWIPVDPVPIEASLEFVVGSHGKDLPWYLPRTFMTEEAKWFPEGSLPETPEIDRATAVVSSWALEPGDVVAFHMQTIHGSAGTSSRRRALAARYVGDDVRHAVRPWRTSPEFPLALKDRLADGAILDDPLFPIVFPKSKMSPPS